MLPEKTDPKYHSRLLRLQDAEILFTRFMVIMNLPDEDFESGEADLKLQKLKEDGAKYGF
jgi:hypothetical protein